MAVVKTGYAANVATTLACGLAGLAAGASRESAAADNYTTDKFLDAFLQVRVKTNAVAPTGDKAVYVYAWGITDMTTPIYPDRITGVDAAITLDSPTQLEFVKAIFCPAASTTYTMNPKSMASIFQGTLPPKWGLAITNATGNALDAVTGSFLVAYLGINATSL